MARSPLPWLGGLLLLYLGVPIVAFCVRLAITDRRGFHDPGLFPALATSVVAACISTAIITLLGVPLAFVLARSRGRVAALVGLLVQLPLAVPPVMAGILLIYVVGPYTPIGRLFDGALTGTLAGVVLAQTFVAAPFLVVTARAAFAAVDPSLGDVAATLGHGPVGRFWRVFVPAAAQGVRAGMILAWLRAFGEYGATVILAYHPTSLPVYTFTEFSATGLPGTMAPTALALAVAACAVGLSRLVVVRRRRRRWSAMPRAEMPPPAVPAPIAFDIDHRLGTFHLRVSHQGRTARLAVLGPSGSGKSTLLRCLAGLYGPAPGPVRHGDRVLSPIPPERRRVGYVAQSFGLFPHLTVWEQLCFATDADPAAAAHWLGHLQLDGLEDRLPDQLSGGQRQRVALAQALARSPEVLLLDEPFSAVDTPVRHELRRELRRLQRETGISTVVVTHDPEEAALLADEVLVVADGVSLQQGPLRTVYSRPVTPDAARLLGVRNVFEGRVRTPGTVTAGGATVLAHTDALPPGSPVVWSVRPTDLVLHAVPGPDGEPGPSPVVREHGGLGEGGRGEGGGEGGSSAAVTTLQGTVTDMADLGAAFEAVVSLDGGFDLEVRATAPWDVSIGDRCIVRVPSSAVSVWRGGAADEMDRSLGGRGAPARAGSG